MDKYLPGPGSGAGCRASEYVLALILMLNGGGRKLENLREIRDDVGLREVLGIERVASDDATGDWLRRAGVNGSLEGLGEVDGELLKGEVKRDKRKG